MPSVRALNVGRSLGSPTQHDLATFDFGRGVIRNNRPQTVQHHAYIDIPRVRHGRPGKFPREHLPDHDTKAVDVAGIGASSGIEHLRSTKKDIL